MTYSIVARDPETGEIGVAVETCGPRVGAAVPWVEPGVGGVATQSFTNIALGPSGLERLRTGLAAADALHDLIAGDPGRELRQVGIVDADGRSAAHTGSGCVAAAGHACAPGVSVQGNMLERPGAWTAMLEAFRGASGDLADRLLVALRAGEAQGGDVRGSHSAALLVAPGAVDAPAWARRYDLRVDQSQRPLEELERLLRFSRGYEALDAAIVAATAGDLESALAGTTLAYGLALGDAQVAIWHAAILLACGRADEAHPVLEGALMAEPRIAHFGPRYADAGHSDLLATAVRELLA